MRLFVCAALASILVGMIGVVSAGAAKPSYGCGQGFNLGPVAATDYLLLPRTAAAIDAGLVDEEFILAGFNRADTNGDGFVCVQLSQGLEQTERPFGQYMYNVSDNNSAKR